MFIDRIDQIFARFHAIVDNSVHKYLGINTFVH